jgi:hypothetical protein
VRHYRDGELVVIKEDFYPLMFRNEKAIVMSSKQVFKDENSCRDYKIFVFKTGHTTIVSGLDIESIEGDE